MSLLIAALLVQILAQAPAPLDAPDAIKPPRVVPVGTVIPVNLTSRISTKHAKDGDGIYAQTAVPVVVDDEIVIPAGSFVRGKIAHVLQPGRIKGRAEMSFNFQSIVLPTGKTLVIYASLGGTGGAIQRKGEAGVVADKGNDVEDIVTDGAKGAGTGAVVGAIGGGRSRTGGAATGALVGAAAGAGGAAIVALIRRGDALVLEPGALIEIVLDRPIER